MLITVAFLCGILTRLPTHADKFPDTCPCFPLYPPREFVKYFSLLSLLLSEYCGFIRTKLLHILSNALYSPFFLNFERRSRSGLPELGEDAFAECSGLFASVLLIALFAGALALKNVSFAENSNLERRGYGYENLYEFFYGSG